MTTTHRKEIECEMALHGETWADAVECSLTDEELERPFNPSVSGLMEFTVYTRSRLYYSLRFSPESVYSVPRTI